MQCSQHETVLTRTSFSGSEIRSRATAVISAPLCLPDGSLGAASLWSRNLHAAAWLSCSAKCWWQGSSSWVWCVLPRVDLQDVYRFSESARCHRPSTVRPSLSCLASAVLRDCAERAAAGIPEMRCFSRSAAQSGIVAAGGWSVTEDNSGAAGASGFRVDGEHLFSPSGGGQAEAVAKVDELMSRVKNRR